jgi:glutathione peroxidase
MKRWIIVIMSLQAMLSGAQSFPSIHTFKALSITGDTINFADYYGKKLMIVNTASFCGYTYQFEALQRVYNRYRDLNFEIIGFPSNDFGSQDPGTDSTILEFCEENYQVTFQMMSKVVIAKPDTSEIYRWLQKKSRNGVQDARVTWNFFKFLIDETGKWVKYYPSTTAPEDSAIIQWIKSPSPIIVTSLQEEEPVRLVSANPATGFLSLINNTPEILNGNLQIVSLEGKVVVRQYLPTFHSGKTETISLSGIPTGMYILNLNTAQFNKSYKLLITGE